MSCLPVESSTVTCRYTGTLDGPLSSLYREVDLAAISQAKQAVSLELLASKRQTLGRAH